MSTLQTIAIPSFHSLASSHTLETSRTGIVLAEELTLVREGLAALCNSIPGFRVISHVGTAESALEEILRLKPGLALLDIDLPDLAVTEVIRRVMEAKVGTRCGVLSARKDRKTVLEVLRNGACGFVLKSSSAQQMAEALTQFTQGGIYVSPQIEIMAVFSASSRRNSRAKEPIDCLSSREFQVFSLLVEGVRAKEIAARLSLSPKTVDTYRSSLMRKLEIYDVAGLVKFAIKNELAG